MKEWLETRQVLDRLAQLGRAGKRAALATVVRVRGSAYRHEGAKLLVAEDGSATGNVSGGCLEQDVREVALQVIRSGTVQRRSYCSGADEIAAWDLGVGCEGEVEVLVEPAPAPLARERELLDGREAFAVCTAIPGKGEEGRGKRMIVATSGAEGDLGSPTLTAEAVARARELLREERAALEQFAGHAVFIDVLVPPPELVVLGAGDDARPLVRCAADVGFRVIVVDRRPAHLTVDRFPGAARLVPCDSAELPERLTLDESSYAVVMTHNFADDRAYARALLATRVAYIGMLGPRERTERILREVRGGGPGEAARVYGPVGLDIGTDGAEQVALSVVAEILAVRSGRRTRSLRERGVPIHAPGD